MKNFFADMKMYGRYVFGLKDFLRHKMSQAEAEAIVQQRMAERDTNFLRLMEKGIFGYAKSPYRPLLELAGWKGRNENEPIGICRKNQKPF